MPHHFIDEELRTGKPHDEDDGLPARSFDAGYEAKTKVAYCPQPCLEKVRFKYAIRRARLNG